MRCQLCGGSISSYSNRCENCGSNYIDLAILGFRDYVDKMEKKKENDKLTKIAKLHPIYEARPQ